MQPRKIIGFAIGPILSGLLGLVSLPVLAWNFSPTDIGRLAMLQVATSLCVIVFSLGMDQAYVREFHEASKAKRPKLLAAALLPGLSLLIAVSASILVFRPAWPSLFVFELSSSRWSLGLFIAIITAYVSRFLSLILRMQEQGLAFSLSQSLPKVLFLVVVIGAWIFGTSSFSVLLVAHVGTVAVVLGAYLVLTREDWVPGLAAKFDWDAMQRMLRFGAPLVVGGLASWAVMTLDKVLLRQLSSLDELGVYSVAASIASAVGVATVLFTTIWVPTVYKWHAQGDAWPRVKTAAEHALAGVCLVMALAGLFSPLVAHVLPERYALVPNLIPACMILPLFYALSEATAVGLGLGRKSLYSMAASLVGAACGLAAGIAVVPALGARGAAIAAAVGAYSFLLARTELAGLAWRRLPRARVYLATAGMAVMACAYAVLGIEQAMYWVAAWSIALLAAGWIFRGSIRTGRLTLSRIFEDWKESRDAN